MTSNPKVFVDQANALIKKYKVKESDSEELSKDEENILVHHFFTFQYIYPAHEAYKNVVAHQKYLVKRFGQRVFDEEMKSFQLWQNQCEENKENGVAVDDMV